MGKARRTESRHRSGIRTCVLGMRAMLPWCLFWMAARPLLGLQWPPFEWSGSFGRLVAALSADLATALPLALFAAGVVVLREMGFTRQLIRTVITASIVVGAISYGLVAWVAPTMIHRTLVSSDDTMDAWPVTPSEILRDLRYVEANPFALPPPPLRKTGPRPSQQHTAKGPFTRRRPPPTPKLQTRNPTPAPLWTSALLQGDRNPPESVIVLSEPVIGIVGMRSDRIRHTSGPP